MFPSDSNLESKFTFETEATPVAEEPPFHILMLGDWSGNFSRSEIGKRKPIIVDRDNFESVIQKLQVGLLLDLYNDGRNVLQLRFNGLDDFHPDRIFEQVALFSELRDVRRRLLRSDTFDEAADEVNSWFSFEEDQTGALLEVQPELNDAPPVESTNLLDMILAQPGGTSASVKPQTTESAELRSFVSKIVSPHLVRIDEKEQSKLVRAVDEAVSALMRSILHHPKFQEIEAAWRGLYFLTRRLETDVDLKIYILNISKEELSDNLKSVNNLADSVLYRWLVTDTLETPGGEPYAVVGGNYSFGVNVEDIAALMRITKVSAAADAPFISYIHPEIFGKRKFFEFKGETRLLTSEKPDTQKLWTALRSSDESRYLGLSPMGFLGRLPYGEATDATETFVFEEFISDYKPENCLWINPCFAAILLLAQSYRLNGWEMSQNLLRDIDNLPVLIFKEDEEIKAMPNAEVVLTEGMLETILDQGLLPLISFRDSGKVRIPRFQSVCSTSTNLSGRWSA